MSNPFHTYETDAADVSLAAGATIFSGANSGSVPRYVVLDVAVGNGTKDLTADADTVLTLTLSAGGVSTDSLTVTIPSGQARWRKSTEPLIWLPGEILALSASSDNAGDTDVNVSVTAYDVAPLQPATSGRPLTVDASGRTDLVDAPNATAVGAIQSGLSTFDASADLVNVGYVEGTDATDYFGTVATATNVSDAQSAIISHGDTYWVPGGGGGGSGAYELVFDVTVGGTLVPDADVVITQINSAIDENVVDARRSNANGSVTFPGIDAGVYWVHIQKTGGPQANSAVKLTVVDGDDFTFASI